MKKRTIRRTALSNTELARVTGGAVPARYYYKQSFGINLTDTRNESSDGSSVSSTGSASGGGGLQP